MSDEKEDSPQGEIHDYFDSQQADKRLHTSKVLMVYNKSSADESEKRLQILKDLLGNLGNDVWIEPPFYTTYGENINLGKTIYLNCYCRILDVAPVKIGDFVLFGPAVHVYTSTHDLSPAERKSEHKTYGKPVEIGADVWIGGAAIICPGVKIGDGAVIGAGSVVTKDVPPSTLVVGNPGRVIRVITDENCPKWVRTEIGSEKERMLRGELYNALDPQLCEERLQARTLAKEYNSTSEEETEKRNEILKSLFGQIGENTSIEAPIYCDYGINTTLGKNVHIHSHCVILDVCPVTIGDNAIVGHSVQIYPATHPLGATERRTGLECGKPIKIGSNVWVGNGAVLCPGVSIGDGSVIGAGSVVSKDIPPNVVAAGNPCRVIEELNVK